jgi:hypothetical protein
VFEGTDPAQIGGYSYAGDNPVLHADPTGKDWWDDVTSVVNTVANVAQDVAPVLNVVAVATAAVPGLDVVTAAAAGAADTIATVATVAQGAVSVANDVMDGKSLLDTGLDVLNTYVAAKGLKGEASLAAAGDGTAMNAVEDGDKALGTAEGDAARGSKAATSGGDAAPAGDGDFVDLYKAPQRGQRSAADVVDQGFDPADYPGPEENPYFNGKAYFGKDDDSIAQKYASHYGQGVVRVRIPREDYDRDFAQYEMPYEGGPKVEVAIPNTVIPVLNGHMRELMD